MMLTTLLRDRISVVWFGLVAATLAMALLGMLIARYLVLPLRSAPALNTLLIALSNGEGFIKITGEVGTGKTLLCRKFLGTLDAACRKIK